MKEPPKVLVRIEPDNISQPIEQRCKVSAPQIQLLLLSLSTVPCLFLTSSPPPNPFRLPQLLLWRETGVQSRLSGPPHWLSLPTASLPSCSKSGPQLPQLYNGDNNTTLEGLWKEQTPQCMYSPQHLAGPLIMLISQLVKTLIKGQL